MITEDGSLKLDFKDYYLLNNIAKVYGRCTNSIREHMRKGRIVRYYSFNKSYFIHKDELKKIKYVNTFNKVVEVTDINKGIDETKLIDMHRLVPVTYINNIFGIHNWTMYRIMNDDRIKNKGDLVNFVKVSGKLFFITPKHWLNLVNKFNRKILYIEYISDVNKLDANIDGKEKYPKYNYFYSLYGHLFGMYLDK